MKFSSLLDKLRLKDKPAERDVAKTEPDMTPSVRRRFAVERSDMFDLERTARLDQLFRVDRRLRDEDWLERFFDEVWNASLEIGSPPVFQGPDGFPYMRLHVPAPGQGFESNSLANQAEVLVENATGAAIFAGPEAEEPEYVMSMGLIDTLLRHDTWKGDPLDLAEIAAQDSDGSLRVIEEGEGHTQFMTTANSDMLIGTPAPSYLPPHTARALHRHLTEGWKMDDPRIALVVHKGMVPSRSLMVSRSLGEFPDPDLVDIQVRMLLWYLPPRQSILLRIDSIPVEDMTPLADLTSKEAPRPS